MKTLYPKMQKSITYRTIVLALLLTLSCFRTQAEQTEQPKPDKPIGFGFKCIWLTVSATEPNEVANFLGLKKQQTANWAQGIQKAYSDQIFVSPPVNNLIFIIGISLPGLDAQINIAEVLKMTNALSQRFGRVDYFVSHRVVDHHGWLKSIDGKLVRAYAYIGETGETTINTGALTKFEQKFNLVDTLSQRPSGINTVIPDETFVMQVAENWGVNPTKLHLRKDIKPGLGIVGFR